MVFGGTRPAGPDPARLPERQWDKANGIAVTLRRGRLLRPSLGSSTAAMLSPFRCVLFFTFFMGGGSSATGDLRRSSDHVRF